MGCGASTAQGQPIRVTERIQGLDGPLALSARPPPQQATAKHDEADGTQINGNTNGIKERKTTKKEGNKLPPPGRNYYMYDSAYTCIFFSYYNRKNNPIGFKVPIGERNIFTQYSGPILHLHLRCNYRKDSVYCDTCRTNTDLSLKLLKDVYARSVARNVYTCV